MKNAKTYETAYTRYPFAPLVTLGLEITAWLKGAAKRPGTPAKSTGSKHVAGPVGHAA